jgi:hypothetical protein
MLRELLLRDLSHHRRVLVSAALLPLVLLASLGLPGGPGGHDSGVMQLVLGLMVLAMLPLSLQLREDMLGTLSDLLALPVARRDVVRLRFLEGFLACAGMTLLHLLRWLALGHSGQAWLSDLFREPALLWMLVFFLAYPMPFGLRWGAKGLGLAIAGFIGGFFLWAALVVFSFKVPYLGPAVKALQAALAWAARGPAFLPAPVVAFGTPLLLMVVFYRLSVRAFESKDV